MRTRILVITAIIVSLLGLTACGAVSSLKDVGATGDAFMQALKDQDNETSWNMLTKDVQDEIGSQEAWAEFTAPRNFEKWKFTSNSVDNGMAQLEGETTLGSEAYYVTLIMYQVDEVWKIAGIDFTFKE